MSLVSTGLPSNPRNHRLVSSNPPRSTSRGRVYEQHRSVRSTEISHPRQPHREQVQDTAPSPRATSRGHSVRDHESRRVRRPAAITSTSSSSSGSSSSGSSFWEKGSTISQRSTTPPPEKGVLSESKNERRVFNSSMRGQLIYNYLVVAHSPTSRIPVWFGAVGPRPRLHRK